MVQYMEKYVKNNGAAEQCSKWIRGKDDWWRELDTKSPRRHVRVKPSTADA